MNEYEKQANAFLEKTGTEFKAEFVSHDLYFPDDKDKRDIYLITLTRKDKKPYSFRFGQSIVRSSSDKKYYREDLKRIGKRHDEMTFDGRFYKIKPIPPNAYDVLACVTKYDPESFEDFCSNYGYDIDSCKALDIYLKVQDEWHNIDRLFHDVMEEIQEIN